MPDSRRARFIALSRAGASIIGQKYSPRSREFRQRRNAGAILIGRGASRQCPTPLSEFPQRSNGRCGLSSASRRNPRRSDNRDDCRRGKRAPICAALLHRGLVIATKGGKVRYGPGQRGVNGSSKHLRAAAEGRRRRLRVDTIDLYFLHAPDPSVELEDSFGTALSRRDELAVNGAAR